MTASKLADSMMVTKGAVTQFIDKLEADGLVTRTRLPNDRRVFLVKATAKSRARFDKIRFAAIGELSQTFDGFEVDDIRKLQKLLGRLLIRRKEYGQLLARRIDPKFQLSEK